MVTSFESRQRILELKDYVVANFSAEDWLQLGVLTGFLDEIRSHGRLIRSMRFGDDDYSEHALSFLLQMADRDARYIGTIEQYLSDKFEVGGANVSSVAKSGMKYYFTPTVFDAPSGPVDPNLVSVMMPFSHPFEQVFHHIKSRSEECGLTCLRAKDIWENSTVIQDVFQLIWRSFIVVCDFTGKNPNVFYEAGIAHTLGKHVIPITQIADDIPFDLRHHRYIQYLNNDEGNKKLQIDVGARISFLTSQR